MCIEQREVVIVGAEPGGLQMAYYLQKHDIDYIICEASDKIADFLEKYLITRKLDSLSKKYHLHDQRNYDFRSDWNSLLCENPELDFANYTDDPDPDADIILKYLQDYISKNNLNIHFNSKVRIRLNEDAEDESSRFSVIDNQGKVIHCRLVMLATGAVSPIPEQELGYSYRNLATSSILDNLQHNQGCLVGRGIFANKSKNYQKKRNSPNVARLNLEAPLQLADTQFARDLPSQDFDHDGWQLEILHFDGEDPVSQLTKKVDGHIKVMTPKRMSSQKRSQASLIDDTNTFNPNLKFIDPRLFDGFAIATNNGYNHLNQPNPAPTTGKVGRFPSLSSWGETSVPGIYYIGTAAQVNDCPSVSPDRGSIPYQVRGLFAHLQAKYWSSTKVESINLSAQFLLENYNHNPLPTQRIPCRTPMDLLRMARDFACFYSMTDSLPAMVGRFGDVLIFDSHQKSFKWWHDQPLHYILNAREEAREFYLQHTNLSPTPLVKTEDNHHFLAHEHVFILTMEYNRANCPEYLQRIDPIKSITQPKINHSEDLRPVIRYFHLGNYVSTLLIPESLSGRFAGKLNYPEFNDADTCRIYNYLLRCFGKEFFPNTIPIPEKLATSPEYNDVEQLQTTKKPQYGLKNADLLPLFQQN